MKVSDLSESARRYVEETPQGPNFFWLDKGNVWFENGPNHQPDDSLLTSEEFFADRKDRVSRSLRLQVRSMVSP